MNWVQGEPGPTCFCGKPTIVFISDDSAVDLFCMLHQNIQPTMFPLPKNDKPEHWPNMTDQEMIELVNKGMEEANND